MRESTAQQCPVLSRVNRKLDVLPMCIATPSISSQLIDDINNNDD